MGIDFIKEIKEVVSTKNEEMENRLEQIEDDIALIKEAIVEEGE